MKILVNQEIDCYEKYLVAESISNLEFRNCSFISVSMEYERKVEELYFFLRTQKIKILRSVLSDVRIINCEETACNFSGVVFENTLIDGLNTNETFCIRASVFKHVILKGKIGTLVFDPLLLPGITRHEDQDYFDRVNREFYKNLDWALDIREARFYECDLLGVPSNLIRRDPQTQMVIKREKALKGTWKKLNLFGTYWDTAINNFLDSKLGDVVFAAPKEHPDFHLKLDGLKKLRDVGGAEIG